MREHWWAVVVAVAFFPPRKNKCGTNYVGRRTTQKAAKNVLLFPLCCRIYFAIVSVLPFLPMPLCVSLESQKRSSKLFFSVSSRAHVATTTQLLLLLFIRQGFLCRTHEESVGKDDEKLNFPEICLTLKRFYDWTWRDTQTQNPLEYDVSKLPVQHLLKSSAGVFHCPFDDMARVLYLSMSIVVGE